MTEYKESGIYIVWFACKQIEWPLSNT